jgi:hypothetical protein
MEGREVQAIFGGGAASQEEQHGPQGKTERAAVIDNQEIPGGDVR